MKFPDRETVERVRAEYPAGTRVILEEMSDPQTPPAGTYGTVLAVDDTASLIMRWDNGSGLNVVYGVDRVRKAEPMPDEIRDAVLQVRATGRTNMFDIPAVQRIAYEMDLYALVCWLEEPGNRKSYVHFIMTGEG